MTQLAAICLLLLHAPTGHSVQVNADSIVTLRSPGSGGSTQHFTGDAVCMISTSDSKFIGVKESCETVRQMTAQCIPGRVP